MMNGLPKIMVLSLQESRDRRENFIQQGVAKNYKFVTVPRFKDTGQTLLGAEMLHPNSYGPVASHLANLFVWYRTSSDPYCIVMEDDVSFDTVKYWNFTFKEFIEELPSNWEAVQLVVVSENREPPKFRRRLITDWCAAVFLMKREYVKNLLAKHVVLPDIFNIYIDSTTLPIVENVLFDSKNPNVYSYPLFLEDVSNCKSTYIGTELPLYNGQGPEHHESHNFILNWWKNNKITLKDIFYESSTTSD
jgi:hypothetical protein